MEVARSKNSIRSSSSTQQSMVHGPSTAKRTRAWRPTRKRKPRQRCVLLATSAYHSGQRKDVQRMQKTPWDGPAERLASARVYRHRLELLLCKGLSREESPRISLTHGDLWSHRNTRARLRPDPRVPGRQHGRDRPTGPTREPDERG